MWTFRKHLSAVSYTHLDVYKRQVYEIDAIKVIIDKRHLMYVIGTEVDFEETDNGAGFTVVK